MEVIRAIAMIQAEHVMAGNSLVERSPVGTAVGVTPTTPRHLGIGGIARIGQAKATCVLALRAVERSTPSHSP